MTPRIGINCNVTRDGREAPAMALRLNYVDCVVRAGGTPFVLPPVTDAAVVREQVAACDGFIFVGGPDITPSLYGQDQHPTTVLLPERREAYDFLLIDAVRAVRKPFLAVCLGCQEVNVAFGGTLIQDIVSQTPTGVQHSMKHYPHLLQHEVEAEEGSRVAALAGATRFVTNSAHHQAMDQVGKGLRTVARCAADGIVEAFEVEDYPFGVAVQWHPEYMQTAPEHQALFRGLVEAATAAKAGNP